MIDFNNIQLYNSEMAKSMIDKIFFADKIDAAIIVDYGCADGSTIAFLYHLFPEWTYIGFDISEEQANLARQKAPYAKIFTDFKELKKYLDTLTGKKAVVCNSLIHEVYSYGSPNDIKNFWNNIFDNFDYICIRDMMLSETSVRQSDANNVLKVRKTFEETKLREFEHLHGKIDQNWPLIHFLLKYRYTDNWEREVNENYLPINLEAMLRMIPRNFEPVLFHHYTLPFVRKKVREDFNIDLQDNTHIQLILEKVN